MTRNTTSRLAVIGGGPAGLMAAEAACAAGIRVDLYDAMGSVGRKFLLAGKGGLNLTHGEPFARFAERYGERRDEIARWLLDYDLGEVRALRGIASGIENSNFFLTMEQDGVTREYVLTIFERLRFEQLPYYLHLMDHLARHGISVPAPMPARDGEILRELKGKPATIVTRLPGASQLAPQADHCAEVGTMLARMHVAGRDYPRQQPNLRSLAWWRQTQPEITPFLDASQRELLSDEIAHQSAFFASAATPWWSSSSSRAATAYSVLRSVPNIGGSSLLTVTRTPASTICRIGCSSRVPTARVAMLEVPGP